MSRKARDIQEHLDLKWPDGAENLKGVQQRLGLSKEAMIGWLTANCQRDSNEINIPKDRIHDWGKYLAEACSKFVEAHL